MGVIYQLTFFLALALLAIVATLFVLAVSLLGRAIKMASEEQEKAAKQQKDDTEKEIARIQKQITKARKTGQLDIEDLEKSLKQMRKQDKKYERALKRIKEKPRFLKARWGVLIPGAFFIASIIFSGLALNLVGSAFIASLWLWGVALVTIGVGTYLICQSLIVIEGVAITSEETAIARQAEQLKTALREVEEEKKPKLELIFEDRQPPFHIEAGAQMTIKFSLSLIQGDIARKPIVMFLAPPGFDFPGSLTWSQSKDRALVGGHITTQLELEECRRGISPMRSIIVKAPSDQGSFSLRYRLTCESFDSGYEEFEVIVE